MGSRGSRGRRFGRHRTLQTTEGASLLGGRIQGWLTKAAMCGRPCLGTVTTVQRLFCRRVPRVTRGRGDMGQGMTDEFRSNMRGRPALMRDSRRCARQRQLMRATTSHSMPLPSQGPTQGTADMRRLSGSRIGLVGLTCSAVDMGRASILRLRRCPKHRRLLTCLAVGAGTMAAVGCSAMGGIARVEPRQQWRRRRARLLWRGGPGGLGR